MFAFTFSPFGCRDGRNPARKPGDRRRAPAVEDLEGRRLLSGLGVVQIKHVWDPAEVATVSGGSERKH